MDGFTWLHVLAADVSTCMSSREAGGMRKSASSAPHCHWHHLRAPACASSRTQRRGSGARASCPWSAALRTRLLVRELGESTPPRVRRPPSPPVCKRRAFRLELLAGVARLGERELIGSAFERVGVKLHCIAYGLIAGRVLHVCMPISINIANASMSTSAHIARLGHVGRCGTGWHWLE